MKKWFRVATEGATTDGRAISRAWIEQMAKNFNPQKYGARVWLEHMRGMFADGPFKALGDFHAVRTEENADGKLELYAEIEPTQDLITMNKDRQKIYTSIEVDPEFSDTGEAYLVGLAVTDPPLLSVPKCCSSAPPPRPTRSTPGSSALKTCSPRPWKPSSISARKNLANPEAIRRSPAFSTR